MHFESTIHNGHTVAVVAGADEPVIKNTSSALDLLMAAHYEAETDRIAIAKELVIDDFFILSSGVAGEILQKYVNYQMKIAIYGDYSSYTSKPLHDFIRESNKGHDFFFVASREEAIDKLASV